jgi:hypothetical protein
MAATDWPYWHQAPAQHVSYGVTTTACNHGTPAGAPCFYCQHPAIGLAQPSFTLGGWRCVCGRGFSPAVTQCPYCGPDAATADGSMPGDDCVPVSEGGLCVPGSEQDRCTGGRHCSC